MLSISLKSLHCNTGRRKLLDKLDLSNWLHSFTFQDLLSKQLLLNPCHDSVWGIFVKTNHHFRSLTNNRIPCSSDISHLKPNTSSTGVDASRVLSLCIFSGCSLSLLELWMDVNVKNSSQAVAWHRHFGAFWMFHVFFLPCSPYPQTISKLAGSCARISMRYTV